MKAPDMPPYLQTLTDQLVSFAKDAKIKKMEEALILAESSVEIDRMSSGVKDEVLRKCRDARFVEAEVFDHLVSAFDFSPFFFDDSSGAGTLVDYRGVRRIEQMIFVSHPEQPDADTQTIVLSMSFEQGMPTSIQVEGEAAQHLKALKECMIAQGLEVAVKQPGWAIEHLPMKGLTADLCRALIEQEKAPADAPTA